MLGVWIAPVTAHEMIVFVIAESAVFLRIVRV
jgi:hypothetical protein